jgi:cytochrome b561
MNFKLRYHPVVVMFHWLTAALMAVMLYLGYARLSDPGLDPDTLPVLRIHMAGGMVILTFTLVRLIVRWRTGRNSHTPRPKFQRAHLMLYGVVILTILVGYVNAIDAGLPAIVFGGSGDPLPPDFHDRIGSVTHRWLAWTLSVQLLMHAGAPLLRRFSTWRAAGILARDLLKLAR